MNKHDPFTSTLIKILHPMIHSMIRISDTLPLMGYDPTMIRLASMLTAVQLVMVAQEPIPSDILIGIATYCETISKMIREIQTEKEAGSCNSLPVPGSSDLN